MGGVKMAKIEKEENFLTAPQAAKLLGIGQETLRNWGRNGKLIPHHVSLSGYRYYTEEQIQQFLAELGIILSHSDNQQILESKNNSKKAEKKLGRPKKTQEVNVSQKSQDSQEKTPKKKMGRPPKPKPEKPLFKLYVDSKTGNTWTNYYAMRSGKTNAFCFATNPDAFQRQSQMIDGQVIQSDDDKFYC